MIPPPELSELAQRILSGDSPELRRLAAEGLAPLPLDELLFVQVALARSDDADISFLARTSLAEVDPRVVANLLRESADPEIVAYFAHHSRHPLLLEAVVQRREVSATLLEEIAPRLPAEVQETLLLRQDAILEVPAILDALERNPELSSFAVRRLREYREHLVRDQAQAVGLPSEEADELPEVVAIRQAFEAVEQLTDVEQEEVGRLNAARIRALPLAARLQLARRAPRALRLILIRDQHPSVALAVPQLNRLTDDEVEQISRSRTVVVDVLALIGQDRFWSRRYPVIEALVRNPKTPTNIALRLMPRLATRSLKQAMWDRNIPAAVREQARRLYTIRTR
ncbi:MAG: hypothetical protein ACRD0X_02145 [Thermoanaerobaculia bacterium]